MRRAGQRETNGEDQGLREMVEHEMPSAEAARESLYQFHDESRIEAAQQELPVGWEEMDLAVADQFRDGNVPAQKDPLAVAQRALMALPETFEEYYFRRDSACWERSLLQWLRDPERQDGPAGLTTFAISVRMTPNLKTHMLRLGDSEWKPYREDSDAVSECADSLNHWPEDEERPEGQEPSCYIAIRVRKRQEELFADGSEERYFCVASNQWQWSAKKLLEWHREKAGSIEARHDVLKNELAAGVMPCGRFGADAAWLRFAVMTHNALTALKRVALKDKWLRARPKRLRFHLFYSPAKLIHHARSVVAKVQRKAAELAEWAEAWSTLPSPA